MGTLILVILLGVGGIIFLIAGLFSDRTRQAQEELEELEGVIDVRRKAENAKHNNPDAIKRVRNKYNDTP